MNSSCGKEDSIGATDPRQPPFPAPSPAKHRPMAMGGGIRSPPSFQGIVFQNFTRPVLIHNRTIVFTFRTTSYGEPEAGDWIGLFRVRKAVLDSCDDISYVWAKDDSIPISNDVYQISLKLLHDEDLEPDVMFCLSYVTMSCQFVGCSKRFWIHENQIVQEDAVTVSASAASKCHFEGCSCEEGCSSDDTYTSFLSDPSCFAIYNLNDWLAYTAAANHRKISMMKRTQPYRMPYELWQHEEDPQATFYMENWPDDSHTDEMNVDFALVQDKIPSEELESGKKRASLSSSIPTSDGLKGNNSITGDERASSPSSADKRSDSETRSVRKQATAEETPVERKKSPERLEKTGSASSMETFFEAVNAEEAFNSLYSELTITRCRVETLTEELKYAKATNEMFKDELDRYKTVTAAHGEELENCSQQISSQAQTLKSYVEKSIEQSSELKYLTDRNESLLGELKSEKERADSASGELEELKNKIRQLSGELEKKKFELSRASMLEAVRLTDIESLKEKLETQVKEVKVLKDQKTSESGELKRLQSEIISKTTELKLIQEQDQTKTMDLSFMIHHLQSRCEETDSIKAAVKSQGHALVHLRHLASSSQSKESCAVPSADVEQNDTRIVPHQSEAENDKTLMKKLKDDLSYISNILFTSKSNTERLKVEVGTLAEEIQQLRTNDTMAAEKILQLKETNNLKLEELASLKRQLSADFLKYRSNQELLSAKLLRSRVNEQLLAKALEKLRLREERLTEMLKVSDEIAQTYEEHQDALARQVSELRDRSEMLEVKFQKSCLNEEGLRNENTLVENLTTMLRQYEDKLNVSADKLKKVEAKAEAFQLELQSSRDSESKLSSELLETKRRLAAMEDELKCSEDRFQSLFKEADALRSNAETLVLELEKSKANEQSLFCRLQNKGDGFSDDGSKGLSIREKQLSEKNCLQSADEIFPASESRRVCSSDCIAGGKAFLRDARCSGERINIAKTDGCIENNDGSIREYPKSGEETLLPECENNRHSDGKERLSGTVEEKKMEYGTSDRRPDNAGFPDAYANCGKDDLPAVSYRFKAIQRSSSSDKTKSLEDEEDGFESTQSYIIKELQDRVEQQSEEIIQYEEKLKLLLYKALLHDQKFCSEDADISSRTKTEKSIVDRFDDRLEREKRFREDLFAWNELNKKLLMEHLAKIQTLVYDSHHQMENLHYSFYNQQNTSREISNLAGCSKETGPQNRSKSSQDKLTRGISERTFQTEFDSKDRNNAAKNQDGARLESGACCCRPRPMDFQKFSKLCKEKQRASPAPEHRTASDNQKGLKRQKSSPESNNREDQQPAKSNNSKGHQSTLMDDSKEAPDGGVFQRCGCDEARIQTRSLPGLARKQPLPMSTTLKRKFKEKDQLEGKEANPPAPSVCLNPVVVPFLARETNEKPGHTIQHALPIKRNIRCCVSKPNSPRIGGSGVHRTGSGVQKSEKDTEWDREEDPKHDAAYEALKRIGLNLNCFLESLSDGQPEKISLDVVRYPTAEDESDNFNADPYLGDFHIPVPVRRASSSLVSPENSSLASKMKYNLQIPVSHLRQLIFPNRVEPTDGKKSALSVNSALKDAENASASLVSLSLFADNVATVAPSPPPSEVGSTKSRIPKYLGSDNALPSKILAPTKSKVESIAERKPSNGACSSIEARGDGSASIDQSAECNQNISFPKRCNSVENERVPTYMSTGNSGAVCKCKVVRGGRRSGRYTDIVSKRIGQNSEGRRNYLVTKRILPAKTTKPKIRTGD